VRQHVLTAIGIFAAVASIAAEQAQKPEPSPPPQNVSASSTVPLRVQLVISKYKGDKKVTSLPYTISTAVGRPARLRIGADAPYSATRVGVPVKSAQEGQTASPPASFSYRTVGTAIDCTPVAAGDGRYRLDLTISHDSINYVSETTSPPQGPPVFPTFSTTNTLVLKDGETGQLTVAADPITGDVLRVDVTLTVLK
jgi:type II secretory pathway component GspD/PulD (secretin)